MKVKPAAHWNPEASPSFWINHTSRLLMRRFEERLRPLEFGTAYLPVVMALDEHGTLLQKQLAERAHVEQPTMAALLGRMDRDGLITRRPHPTDKRATQISLSNEAKARIPAARAQLEAVAEQALAGFTERERDTLLKLLQRAAKNLDPSIDD